MGNGTLISKSGTYKGYFKNSKAHGKGKFLSLKDRRLCEGIWENGEMKKG